MRHSQRHFVTWSWLLMGMCGALFLNACGMGAIISKTQTYTESDSLVLQTPRPDILDVAVKVGKAMGYDVSGRDRQKNMITLQINPNMLAGMLIGKITISNIYVTSEENGRRLGIRIQNGGNMGTGSEEATVNILKEFKAKILQEVGQKEIVGTK